MKTPTEINRRLKAIRVEFNKLSPADKRVAIARDVLKQINRRVRIERGSFILWTGWQDSRNDALNQAQIHQRDFKCRACAIGAMLISAVGLANKAEVTNGDFPCQIRPVLLRYFSNKQIRLIEIAFERGGGWYDDYNSKPMLFGRKYRSNVARARAIFKNIIRNKGVFVP